MALQCICADGSIADQAHVQLYEITVHQHVEAEGGRLPVIVCYPSVGNRAYPEQQLQLEKLAPLVHERRKLLLALDRCRHLADKVAVACHDACQAETGLPAGRCVDPGVDGASVLWNVAACCGCLSWQSVLVVAVDALVEVDAIAAEAAAAADAGVQPLGVWVLGLQCWGWVPCRRD